MSQTDADIRADIALARELDAAATPGPWNVNPLYPHDGGFVDPDTGQRHHHSRYVESPSRCVCTTGNQTLDVEFIADARTLLPRLADACERLMGERDALAARVAALGVDIVRWREIAATNERICNARTADLRRLHEPDEWAGPIPVPGEVDQ